MLRLSLFLALTLTGCATIRQPTVELSAKVGARIAETQELHMLTLQRYFDAERQKVDVFLKDKWEPLFLKNFLGQSKVFEELNHISYFDERKKEELRTALSGYLTDPKEAEEAVNALIAQLNSSRQNEPEVVRKSLENYVEDKRLNAASIHINALLTTDEPARIMIEFAKAAHDQMVLERNEMMAPIDQMEREAIAALSSAYSELTAAQALITARLDAAARIKGEQDYLLSVLRVKNTTDEVFGGLSKLSSDVDKEFIYSKIDISADSITEKIKKKLVKIVEETKTKPEANKN